MPVRLDRAAPDFEARFKRLLDRRHLRGDVVDTVTAILAAVRARGDEALIRYTAEFDRHEAALANMKLSAGEIAEAASSISKEASAALAFAKKRIEEHHRRQLPEDDRYTDAEGVELGSRWTPIGAVGIYVPGGTASYPSSVLMNAVPAKIAGVRRIVMVVPTPDGVLNPMVLAAARLAGVDEIYRVGGAQAVAALAFGTDTIKPVDKIVGPGNAYVAEAKRQVFGIVGIDSIAGPSEVLIVADGTANADWIAADLLAQAEHDVLAQPILVTNSPELADAVEEAVADQLDTLPRAMIAEESWRDRGMIVVVPSLDDAAKIANRVAAEHVELQVEDPEALVAKVVNAGAIFIGPHTPEAIGDYVGGSNHVLPTAGAARFSSGLSVLDFVKQTSILKCGPDQLRRLGEAAMTLAEAEGLDAHARSVAIRLNR